MLLNKELTAIRDAGTHAFEEADIGGRKVLVMFPDGRRNVMPYTNHVLRSGGSWTSFPSDLQHLSILTGPNAIEIARSLHESLEAVVPGVRIEMEGFPKTPDRPLRFLAKWGRITVHGGIPISMAEVGAEVDRIAEAHADARKAINAKIATWKSTTIDACYVTMAAGMSGLDGEEFFARLARDPHKVDGVVPMDGQATASADDHEVRFPGGLLVRVVGRSVTATLRTSKYTLDAGRLIVKDSPRPPDTVISAVGGRPLEDFVKLPDFDGSEIMIKKVEVKEAGKKLQMTVHFVPQPLRMDAARELYDRLRARAAGATA